MSVLGGAAAFVWLGAVLAISFLETPLKFRAPGITLALGLGIGRLVFRALNTAELVLAALLTLAVATGPALSSGPVLGLLLAAWATLLVQVLGLRPRLERRMEAVIGGRGGDGGPSRAHLGYVALEVLKVPVLATLGVLLTLAAR